MTSSETEIRSLLRLLDDDHPAVREAVKRRVADWGDEFDRALAEIAPREADVLIPLARRLRQEHREDGFRGEWKRWLGEGPTPRKLEDGLIMLAGLLPVPGWDADRIREALDGMARAFLLLHPRPDFRDLALYLFGSGRFTGNEENYYSPENSNLARVLSERRGNPILLSCLMMLVGHRVGLEIGGCNYPAHFLARHESAEDGGLHLIDCFNEGRILPADVLIRHQPFASRDVEQVVREAASVEVILSRVLRNLDHALYRAGRPEEQRFVRDLWRCMASGDAP